MNISCMVFFSCVFHKRLCFWEIQQTFLNNFVSKHCSEPLKNINLRVVYRNAPWHAANSQGAETVNYVRVLQLT
jgi:hypothetical protein